MKVLCTLILVFSLLSISHSQTVSSLQEVVTWSIAHEGCSPFADSRTPGIVPTLSASAALRQCYLSVNARNSLATQLLSSATDEDLQSVTREAVNSVQSRADLPIHIHWVMEHEGLGKVFESLVKQNDFKSVREMFSQKQTRNPDVRNLLAGVSDDALKGFVNQQRLIITLAPDVPTSTLVKLMKSASSETSNTVKDSSLSDIVALRYGVERRELTQAVAALNKLPSSSVEAGYKIPAGTSIELPSISRLNSTMQIVADRNATIEQLVAPFYAGPIDAMLRQQILTANPALQNTAVIQKGVMLKLPGLRATLFLNVRGKIEKVSADLSRSPGVISVRNSVSATQIEHSIVIDRTQLQSEPGVEDPSVSDDWYLKAISLNRLPLDHLHPKSKGLVAVVDGGIDGQHPLLGSHLWQNNIDDGTSSDFTSWTQNAIGFNYANYLESPSDDSEDSHGTHVAGLVSGAVIKALWPSSTWDPPIKLMVLKVGDQTSAFDFSRVDNAIRGGIAHGAHIFNLSLVGPYLDSLHSMLNLPEIRNNYLLIIAAGNGEIDGKKCTSCIDIDKASTFNGTFRGLRNSIFVAALNPSGKLAYFSNWGPATVDIAAPGVFIKSAVRTTRDESNLVVGRTNYLSGTSQATPLVTFTAGTIAALRPDLNVGEIRRRILGTCDLNRDLAAVVRNGCTLNFAKSVSVEDDVIEMRPSGELLYGLIDRNAILAFELQDGTHITEDIDRDDLVRVWLGDQGTITVHSSSGDRSVRDLDNSTLSIRLSQGVCPTPVPASGYCSIEKTKIRDVVFKMKP